MMLDHAPSEDILQGLGLLCSVPEIANAVVTMQSVPGDFPCGIFSLMLGAEKYAVDPAVPKEKWASIFKADYPGATSGLDLAVFEDLPEIKRLPVAAHPSLPRDPLSYLAALA